MQQWRGEPWDEYGGAWPGTLSATLSLTLAVAPADTSVKFTGYGMNNAKTKDNIICRYKFSDRDVVGK